MLGVNRIAVDQRIGFKGSDKPKKDSNKNKDNIFSEISRIHTKCIVSNSINLSKNREEKNGKFLVASNSLLLFGGGLYAFSDVRSFAKKTAKFGAGKIIGLLMIAGGLITGMLNKNDADKTKKERGIKDIVTTPEMEKAKQEQKELTKKIGEENSKALKEDYAQCEKGDGYFYDIEADHLLKVKFMKYEEG